MWVRAVGVAVALVAGCCAATVQAAQYAEVWNPPEAQHAPKHARVVTPASRKSVKAASHAKGKQQTAAAKKGPAQAQGKSKPGAVHMQAKVSAKPGVKVAQKSAGKTTSTSAHTTHLKTAASTPAHGDIKMARSKGAHTLAAARANPQTLAARPAPAHPAQTMASVSTRTSTQPTPQAADHVPSMLTSATVRSADESSSLPPILH